MTDASFVLRVDAGAQVGFGHAGRCVALWEQLRERCVVAVTDATAAAFVRRSGARVADGGARGDVTGIDRAHTAGGAGARARPPAGAGVCRFDEGGPAGARAGAVVAPPTGPAWPE